VAGGWRRLHKEELHNLYASLNIIRVIISSRVRWAGHAAWMGEMRNAYHILVGKPEGNRQLRRPRRRWKYIRIDIREIVWEDVDWMHLAQNRERWRVFVNTAMNLLLP